MVSGRHRGWGISAIRPANATRETERREPRTLNDERQASLAAQGWLRLLDRALLNGVRWPITNQPDVE